MRLRYVVRPKELRDRLFADVGESPVERRRMGVLY